MYVRHSSFWQYKVYALVYADICGDLWTVDVKRQRGRQRQFSVLSLAMSSETLEIRPFLLYNDTVSLVGFPMIPKYMTLNDLEWLFHTIFALGLELFSSAFENKCKNKYT